MKQFTVYQLTREEYNVEFTYLGEDETGESIMDRKIFYSGEKSTFLHTNQEELLRINSLPEWKAKITGSFMAEKGHSKNGTNVYTIHREPITLLS